MRNFYTTNPFVVCPRFCGNAGPPCRRSEFGAGDYALSTDDFCNVALWVSIANAHDKFMAGAAAPILSKFMFHCGGDFNSAFCASDLGIFGALPIAISLLLAGLLQLALLFIVLRRLSALPKLQWPRLSKVGKNYVAQFLAIGAWRWRDASQPLGRLDFGVLVAGWDYLLGFIMPTG